MTTQVYEVLCKGNMVNSGALLTENHQLLREIGVSTPILDQMVKAAIEAGASGAKLSGGGGGGNIIAVVSPGSVDRVSAALLSNGARNIIVTAISGKGDSTHE